MKLIASILLVLPVLAGDAAPGWVREATAQSVPSYPAKVTKVLLLQEESLTVSPDGRRTIRERGAIKFLARDRGSVSAYRSYNIKNGRIREFQAWLLTPDGKETNLGGKDKVLDVALSANYTYDEARSKYLECPRDPPPGSTFAWEIVEEEKTIFTQYTYIFQNREPVLTSRFVLTTPPGWESKGVVLNGVKIDPQVSGTTTTWEMRNLPWIPDEDFRPATHSLAPRIGISYYPSSSASADLTPLTTWPSVSAWLTTLVDPTAEATQSIRAKSAELSGASASLLDKLQAIALFAQQTNYVSVQMNLTRGGGYIPHRAEDVLTRNYGDCKDKATLMRALLKAQGVDSFLTVLYSGDRDYVRPEWPSPFQFNHAIIAIRVPADFDAPAATTDPQLGRLLIFDPTDPHTPLGQLPDEEQGSYALVLAGRDGNLIRLPLLPPDRNHVETTITGSIRPDGGLKAALVRTYSGQAASSMREMLNDDKAVRAMFERSLSQRLGGLSITTASMKPRKSELQATVDFDVNQFGQVLQDRLLAVVPGSIVPGSDYVLTDTKRTLPLMIRARSRHNIIRLDVPAGFVPDEIPDPVKVASEYGEFQARWSVTEGQVVFEQTVRYKDLTVPAADYAKARAFFEEFSGAQGSAVVLIRKN
ncbi:MAG: DUF3857 domain-containing protein [Bryobacteraceae bacterium]|nr:DUF3857 domain-containing protein [Bryobacteraceae bacterium]